MESLKNEVISRLNFTAVLKRFWKIEFVIKRFILNYSFWIHVSITGLLFTFLKLYSFANFLGNLQCGNESKCS